MFEVIVTCHRKDKKGGGAIMKMNEQLKYPGSLHN